MVRSQVGRERSDCSPVEDRERPRSLVSDRCVECGQYVVVGSWHPVAAPENDDRVYTFCTPTCRASWTATEGKQ